MYMLSKILAIILYRRTLLVSVLESLETIETSFGPRIFHTNQPTALRSYYLEEIQHSYQVTQIQQIVSRLYCFRQTGGLGWGR